MRCCWVTSLTQVLQIFKLSTLEQLVGASRAARTPTCPPTACMHAGKGVSTLEQQEAAMEGLLDLVRTPGFVHDVFVNCDCRCARREV